MADFCSCKICISTVLGGQMGEGTTPGMEEEEQRRKLLPRKPKPSSNCRDGGNAEDCLKQSLPCASRHLDILSNGHSDGNGGCNLVI